MSKLSSVELPVLGPLQVRQGEASVVIPGALLWGSTAAWEADADAVALARHDELLEQVVTSRDAIEIPLIQLIPVEGEHITHVEITGKGQPK